MPEIDKFFHFLSKQGGSDLHIRTQQRPMMRIDGAVVALNVPAMDMNTSQRLLSEICPDRNWKEFLDCGDTDFSYEVPGLARFRANLMKHQPGDSIGGVFRIIPSEILTAEQLKLAPAILKLCMLPKGLVLVTGPTGSGKSTTLAAMIDYVNKNRKDHLLTIEDPVEYELEGVNQIPVRPKRGLTFANGLRAIVRQDPDVIMVGEIR
ncbi:MAG: ATPase, T2SS/T4P/T4SS family, partial [Gammaproteobacteria bacterium]|nr:ATPase, T2SS/T4P/T4SS family [Gammaproteobacteria bacterium]